MVAKCHHSVTYTDGLAKFFPVKKPTKIGFLSTYQQLAEKLFHFNHRCFEQLTTTVKTVFSRVVA